MLLTKEWRALPKEERDNYTKQTVSKDYVECVSYAKVLGETRKAKLEYLSQLHTDYHNEVGCKYGLACGIPYNELSEEEKRGRRHKNKVVLEAECQAKAALNKIEKYAVLATIDRKELAFPLLNVKTPVQEVMDAVIESLNTQLASKNEDIKKLKTDYNTLWEKYKILVLQWNDLTKQAEIIEAVKRVEERKEQEAEAKREEQARQDRFQCVLD